MITNKEEEIQSVNNEIEYNQVFVSRYKALERLLKNQDFIDVIFDGFIKENSEQIFKQLLLPINMRTIDKETCNSTLDAISMLNKYIGVDTLNGDLYYQAVRSKDRISELHEYLDVIIKQQ